MFDYIVYFLITLVVSTLFGVVGLGSSLVLIPIFTLLGFEFNLAKAMGLFINGVTTISLTLHNVHKKVLNIKKIALFIVVSSLFALLGAYSSNYISEEIVKTLFVGFIFLSLFLLLIGHRKYNIKKEQHSKIILLPFISVVAFVGGLIGVGGGAVYLPLLLYLGINTRQSIATTSALIPVVSFSAFLSYSSFVTIDWRLLCIVGVGAILGGHFGHKIMNSIHNDKYLKFIIIIVLLTIAIYMLFVK